MDQILFTAYFILFSWLVTRINFLRSSGLTPTQLVVFFMLKVFAGIIYGWIGIYYSNMAQMADTWSFHNQGLYQYHKLLAHPGGFFSDVIRDFNRGGRAKFFETTDSWWNGVKYLFLIKLLAVFDLFSFGNYYTNVIFYSFISFFAPVALYRIFKDVFPSVNPNVLLPLFILPSFLYWSSGLHKEGLIFTSFLLIIYPIYFGLKRGEIKLTHLFLVAAGMALLLILRNFLALVILPAVITWIIAAKIRKPPLLTFTAAYLLFTLLFFSLKYLSPALDFPQAVANRQAEFLELSGGSAVPVTVLEPTGRSFAANFFQAITLSIIRPYPKDVAHILSLAAAIEINLILCLFLLAVFYRKSPGPGSPFVLFCFFFSFSALLTIGYTVNILGAVVRYRSIVLPFLVMPLGAAIDWEKIFHRRPNHIKLY